MRYDFKCEETGEVREFEFPMQDVPRTVKVEEKIFKRVFAFGTDAVIIPFQWGQETNLRAGFKKSPSQQKHFY